MAEFCLECLNEISKTNLTEEDVYTEFDYCERCGKNCPCVIRIIKVEEDE